MQEYNKTIQKMINSDDVVKKEKKKKIEIGHKFLIIHRNY